MNPLVVPVTIVSNKHSGMRNEQWIFNEDFSVFGQIENLRMDKITSKTFKSNSGKLIL